MRTNEEYLVDLSKLKGQESIGKLLGEALKDKAVTPLVYEAMCNTAKDKGFKFVNILSIIRDIIVK